jgi:hypothetical protein
VLGADDRDPSDSAVQREIEPATLSRLEGLHPDWLRTTWRSIVAEHSLGPIWTAIKPDAVWTSTSGEIIVAESYARIGPLKPGHRRKLAMDALKLLALRDSLPSGTSVRSLLVVPEQLVPTLEGSGWFPFALRATAEVTSVRLSPEECERLNEASRLQGFGQARTSRRAAISTE